MEYLDISDDLALRNGRPAFQPGDVVRHFKRQWADPSTKEYLYRIIATATHTETEEPLVIYEALYRPYKICARPMAMFYSYVDREKYPEATQIYRFELNDSAIKIAKK